MGDEAGAIHRREAWNQFLCLGVRAIVAVGMRRDLALKPLGSELAEVGQGLGRLPARLVLGAHFLIIGSGAVIGHNGHSTCGNVRCPGIGGVLRVVPLAHC